MRPQISPGHPITVLIGDNNGIVGADVGLIEDKSLLLRTSPLMISFLQKIRIDIFVFYYLFLHQLDPLC